MPNSTDLIQKFKNIKIHEDDPILVMAKFQIEFEERLNTTLNEYLNEHKEVLMNTRYSLEKELRDTIEKSLRKTINTAKKDINEELNRNISNVILRIKKESDNHCNQMFKYSKHMETVLILNGVVLLLSILVLLFIFYFT